MGLCVASLEMLIDTKHPMPDAISSQIVSASLAIYDDVCRESSPKFHVLLTILPSGNSVFDRRVVEMSSEQEMLEHVMRLIVQFDVDVLVGYDTLRLSWGYFLRRARLLGITESMDRMKTGVHEDQMKEEENEVATPKGRLLVAVWKVVRSDLALRNYDLGSAVANVLKKKVAMLDNATLMGRIRGGNAGVRNDVYLHLLKLSTLNLSILIEMNWFLKNAEMARVYGIQFHEVWTRGSQLRVESMLLRLAHRMNFVAPSITHLQRNL